MLYRIFYNTENEQNLQEDFRGTQLDLLVRIKEMRNQGNYDIAAVCEDDQDFISIEY